MKKEKLALIDKIIRQLNGKLVVSNPKDKGKCCGWNSEESARGFNGFREVTLYNLKIERLLILHDCKSCYELDQKLKKE
jgi:hypothetical protein